ncbi:ABC transporter permease [Paenibacillus cymbidii]|uniref:ABC transporter permease n=1 Tax=Paenibacillus cymbidii TaxID=1639034 RepID=UPI001F2CE528|nr:ABC transporter permease subunit [Paenibacillus cymbidii]
MARGILRLGKHRAFYLMALPGLVYYLLFHYVPMVGVVISFKDYSPIDGLAGIFTSPWVGLEHFEKFFGSYFFVRVFTNTIVISLLKLAFGFPAPIVLALLINEVKNRVFRRIVQTVSYLPHFISWVIVSSMIYLLASPSFGIAGSVLEWFGYREGFYALSSNDFFRGILVGSSIWKEIGWSSIIYLAAISGINPELYESAMIDGASRWKQVRHVTLPSITNVISVLFILNVGGLLDAGFEQIFLLYSPSVYATADIIDTYVYREGLVTSNFSFATAVGMFKSVIAMALIVSANALARRLEAENLW